VNGDRPIDDVAATECPHGPLCRPEFGACAGAFPGDQSTADGEERKRKLDQLGERTDCPGGHDRPAFPMARLPGQLFGSGRRHAGPVGQPGGLDRRGEEGRLLADRVDERDALHGQGRGEGDARKAAAAAEVEKSAGIPDDRGRGQAVDDMPKRDVGGLADRREVDRLVPGKEQPDMVVDRTAGGR